MTTNCYRLKQKLNDKNDPIYAIDKYGDWATLQQYDKDIGDIEVIAQEALVQFNLKGIYLKNRWEKRPFTHTKLISGVDAPDKYSVLENDIKLEIRLKDHLDVGLFLDHKPAREMIRSESKNKDVLNLFAYTGSFSIYASLGGAKTTTTVDLSNTYCEWCKTNFELNKLSAKYKANDKDSNNIIWCEDIFDYLDLAQEAEEKFDIIILDPPSFSRNKDRTFSVAEDHASLIRRLQNNLLRERGFVFFSTNLKDFVLDPYIRRGAEKLTKTTVPQEFLPYRAHQSFVFYN